MVDKKDLKILNELKKNSRESVKGIARKTGLRQSTVYSRIKKLEKDKVIEQFTVKLNDQEMGEEFSAFLLVNTKRDLDESFFADEHLKEAFGITGEFDLLLKLKFRDIAEFNSYLINLRKNKNIAKTLTLVGTIKIKEKN